MYLATARACPTGRGRSTSCAASREIGSFLEARGVKLVVVACNSGTAAASPQLQTELGIPVVGVIAGGARGRGGGATAGSGCSRRRRRSRAATTRRSCARDAGAEVFPVACPRLVPLIEGDDPFAEQTAAAVREYAAPLKPASTPSSAAPTIR